MALIPKQDTSGTYDLLYCPFCGGDDIEITHDTSSDYEQNWSWCVGCVNCDAEFSVCDTEERCVEKWNTRTIYPKPDERKTNDEGRIAMFFTWLKRLLCFVGIHRKDNDWTLKWSSLESYCQCEKCQRYIVRGRFTTFSKKEFYNHF